MMEIAIALVIGTMFGGFAGIMAMCVVQSCRDDREFHQAYMREMERRAAIECSRLNVEFTAGEIEKIKG